MWVIAMCDLPFKTQFDLPLQVWSWSIFEMSSCVFLLSHLLKNKNNQIDRKHNPVRHKLRADKKPIFFWGFFLTVQTRKLKCTEVCIFGLYFLRNAKWSQLPTLPSLQSQRANSPYWLPNFSSNFSVKNLAVDPVNIPQTMPKGSNSRNQSTWE